LTKNKKMNLFKIIIITVIVGLFSVLIFFYYAFRDTTWGGWTPPDVSLNLNNKEKNGLKILRKIIKALLTISAWTMDMKKTPLFT
jgi:hypothetical protein